MTTIFSSESLTVGPIGRIPYDILREIFVHCLPQYRLKARQPNTIIAPMLLCQICSSWRTVALNSATLWSHLPCCLAIATNGNNITPGGKVLKNQFAFFSWWRKNQGSMPPYLCIDISWRRYTLSRYQELELGAVKTTSLFKYIASARYLEIGTEFWYMLHKWNADGHPTIYPTHHTLMKSGYSDSDPFYAVQALIPNHIPSTLRYLSIDKNFLPNNFVIPKHWSKLTRLALEDIIISVDMWFSFIRAVPDLQWGYFGIMLSDGEHDVQAAQYTLPQLSTLCITLRNLQDYSLLEFPLSTLFNNLHLPALQSLSLSSCQESWFDYRATTELYTVLNSTPAITTLTLGGSFLSLCCYSAVILHEIRDTEPVWRHAVHLTHLQLQLKRTRSMNEVAVKESRNTYLRNIFHHDNHFLDLRNPSCPIRKITLIDYFRASDPQSDNIDNFTVAKVQEHLEKAPDVNVVFEITSASENHSFSGAWNEWGPNL